MAPAWKLTFAVRSNSPPIEAVTALVSALLDAKLAVKTPLASVAPLAGVNVFALPVDVSRTPSEPTGLPLSSLMVTVIVVVEVPSAVTDTGLTTIEDAALADAPALNCTVGICATATGPPAEVTVAVIVLISATLEAMVPVAAPLRSVASG